MSDYKFLTRWELQAPIETVWDAVSDPLSFTVENVRQDPPRLLESRSTGQLEGTGRWELSQEGDITTALYYWHVRTTRRWMNLTAPLLRPLFAWNHHKIMDKGGTRLAAYLGARLVANTSREESRA